MGVAPVKTMSKVILSFKAALQCKLTNIVIVNKKSTNKYKEICVILQSIGIIVIKSRETRAVIYTCRYSSGQFNP